MPEKFQNKYRIPSARWRDWDYGWNAAYFVTICVKDRECVFGSVTAGKMHLSDIGKVANDCWAAIPQHFPFVVLDSFVIMPNHIHGIVVINKTTPVETQDFASLPVDKGHSAATHNKFGAQSRNLASIIRGFKTGVTIGARKIKQDFCWQTRYHDSVIRDEEMLGKIVHYIEHNPVVWQEDRYHKG